jgi:hypothetical protein
LWMKKLLYRCCEGIPCHPVSRLVPYYSTTMGWQRKLYAVQTKGTQCAMATTKKNCISRTRRSSALCQVQPATN